MHSDSKKLELIRNARKKLMVEIESLKEQLKKVTDDMRNNGFVQDGKIVDPEHRYRNIAKTHFNNKPKKGIEFLIANQMIKETPEDVAKFFQEPDLNKRSIGDYLGDITVEFNRKVLDAYVRLYDFSNKGFVEGLRVFLSGFFLPGESQKISEIIKAWADFYYECNPKMFNNADEPYILAYAAIMLNTTLNNPNAVSQNIEFGKEEAFIKTMLEYENYSFQEELLKSVYRTIKTDPLMNLGNIINELYPTNKMNGELWYQSNNLRVWKKRTFVLLPECLLILTNENNPQVRYKIALTNVQVDRVFESANRDFILNLHSRTNGVISATKTGRDNVEEQKNMRNFRFACNSSEEQKEWLQAIKQCLNKINENLETSDSEIITKST